MISKLNRFHRRGSLNYVYQKGKTVRSESLSLRYAPSREKDYRLAIVVSRKVSKSAVTRNRIRRRIYEIVRLARKESAKEWPVDMIISVFDDKAAKQPQEELKRSIYSLLGKAGLPK